MAAAAQNYQRGARYRPVAALLLTLVTFTLYTWPKYVAVGSGLKLSPFNFSVLAALAIGLLGLTDARTRPRLNGFGKLALFFFFAHYAVRFYSDSVSGDASDALYDDARDLMWGGSLFLIGLMLGHWPGTLSWVARLICVGMLGVVAAASLEMTTHSSLASIIFTYIPIPMDDLLRTALVFDKTRDGVFRAQSVFLHPIVLGEVAASSLPVLLALLLNRTRIWLPLIAIFACLAAVLISGSRAAQIGVVVGLIAYASLTLLLSRDVVLWGLALITLPMTAGLAVAAAPYLQGLAEGRTEAEQLSTNVRATQWERGLSAIAEAPIVGHGAGSSGALAGVKGRLQSLTVDDWYLTTLLDFGYSGMATFALMLFFVAMGSVNTRLSARDRRLHAGFLAGILVIMICQRALSIAEAVTFQMFFAGLVVAGQVLPQLSEEGR